LVLLKVAMPLVEPSAAALLMVTVEPEPEELARVRTPVKPSNEVTPLHEAKDSTADPLVVKHWPLVPSAVGRVKVKLLLVIPACRLTRLALVPFLKLREFWTVVEPAMVTVVPLSLRIESPMVWEPVNLASLLVVPPGVVTPPPKPTQLATEVQMS
jgi:hypothetical protein